MTFCELLDHIKIGREIDFFYKDYFCSITNFKKVWYYTVSSPRGEEELSLGDFGDTETVEESVKEIVLDSKGLEEIFDQKLYKNYFLY